MRYPLKMTANLAKYVASQRFRGAKKFPMVMMLEPSARLQPDVHGMRPDPRV